MSHNNIVFSIIEIDVAKIVKIIFENATKKHKTIFENTIIDQNIVQKNENASNKKIDIVHFCDN